MRSRGVSGSGSGVHRDGHPYNSRTGASAEHQARRVVVRAAVVACGVAVVVYMGMTIRTIPRFLMLHMLRST